ncbi:MAG: T9SS type A sorting domain-containing protein [Bacteroidetes bacterium]|nr:T9SS type A sorting domain-containing protein [Bacteroidota bacterium]
MKKILSMFAVILGITTTTFAQVPSYVPSDSLKAWYPFTGNANDKSGNGNNGVVSGAALIADRFGITKCAYSFNGSSDYIVANNSLYYTKSAFTVSAWVNIPKSSKGAYGDIIGSWPACGNQFLFRKDYSQGVDIIAINAGNNFGQATIDTSNLGNWMHLVFTMKLNDSLKLYVNGVEVSKAYSPGSITICSNLINIGREENKGGSGYFKGAIDDIGIWSRVLTKEEIFTLYNGCGSKIIKDEPIDQNVFAGNSAVFITSPATTNATYQWQTDLGFGFQNIVSDKGQYKGGKDDSLTILNTTLANNNQEFRCIINTGSCGIDTTKIVTLTVSNFTSLQSVNQSPQFKLYPNPATTQITISITDNNCMLYIYDLTGRLVQQQNLSGQETTVNTENYPKGLYTATLVNNNKVAHIKFAVGR